MEKPTLSIKKTLQKVVMEEEQITGKKYAEEEHVELIFKGIEGVDSATINSFKNCSKLSLSSNLISKVPEIQLDRLKILSIGRNRIKQLKGSLDYVSKTLEQLWVSYNEIEKLDSFKVLINLKKLYIGNNMITKLDELNYLSGIGGLEDVVFKGNPFCLVNGDVTKPVEKDKNETYAEIKKRIPSVSMVDGDLI